MSEETKQEELNVFPQQTVEQKQNEQQLHEGLLASESNEVPKEETAPEVTSDGYDETTGDVFSEELYTPGDENAETIGEESIEEVKVEPEKVPEETPKPASKQTVEKPKSKVPTIQDFLNVQQGGDEYSQEAYTKDLEEAYLDGDMKKVAEVQAKYSTSLSAKTNANAVKTVSDAMLMQSQFAKIESKYPKESSENMEDFFKFLQNPENDIFNTYEYFLWTQGKLTDNSVNKTMNRINKNIHNKGSLAREKGVVHQAPPDKSDELVAAEGHTGEELGTLPPGVGIF